MTSAASLKLPSSAGGSGPKPADASAIVSISPAAQTLANYLLYGTAWKSTNGSAVGSAGNAVNLTYSFIDPSIAGNNYYSSGNLQAGSPYSPFMPVGITDAGTEAAIASALAKWSAVSNLNFQTAGAESSGNSGNLRFGIDARDNTAYAYIPVPNQGPESGDATAGDVMLGGNQPVDGQPLARSWTTNLSPGTYEFTTMMHEIGHALGMRHPHDNGRDATLFSSKANSGKLYDQLKYTVMSYRDSLGASNKTGYTIDFYPTTLMLNDVAAAQYLYGVNSGTASGDSTYSFQDGQKYFQTIYDTGGTDTMDASAETRSVKIDLRAGKFSTLGDALHWTQGKSQTNGRDFVAIAYNAVIENAAGGAGNDTLYGNAANNVLDGGGGNDLIVANPDNAAGADTVDGGDGADTLVLPAMGAGNTWTRIDNDDGSVTLSSSVGGYSVTASNVEYVALAETGIKVKIGDLPDSFDATALLAAVNKSDDAGSTVLTAAVKYNGKAVGTSTAALYRSATGDLFIGKGIKDAKFDAASGKISGGVTATSQVVTLTSALDANAGVRALAAAGDGTYHVYAELAGKIQDYHFDANGGLMQKSETDSTSADVVALEQTARVDLNADGVVGGKVATVLASGKTSGLYTATLGNDGSGNQVGGTFIALSGGGIKAGAVLKTPAVVLKNADGSVWSPPSGQTLSSYSYATLGGIIDSITINTSAGAWVFDKDGLNTSQP